MLWGLACDGQRGVQHILDILARELDNIMANSGLPCIMYNLSLYYLKLLFEHLGYYVIYFTTSGSSYNNSILEALMRSYFENIHDAAK